MADWDTRDFNVYENTASTQLDSRRSSYSSGLSNGLKESSSADDSSDRGLVLKEGDNLKQESVTENDSHTYQNFGHHETNGMSNSQPHIMSPGTAKAKAAKSPFAPSTIDSVPEEEIVIPSDANLSAFTKDEIANFLRCLKIDDRIISHLHRKNVDGKRFSRLKDSELENVGMKNPVIVFFRDKSSAKNKRKQSGGWVL